MRKELLKTVKTTHFLNVEKLKTFKTKKRI